MMRDYEKDPLKRGELPDIEDVKYAYLDLNLSLKAASDFLKVSSKKVRIVLHKNNIIKSKELIGNSGSLVAKTTAFAKKE